MWQLGGYPWMHDGTKGPIEHQKGFMKMRARCYWGTARWQDQQLARRIQTTVASDTEPASHAVEVAAASSPLPSLDDDGTGILLLQRYREAMDDLRAIGSSDSEEYVSAYYDAVVKPLRRSYAWAVPTKEALECIAQHAPPEGVVEIGSGTGYWAHLLRSCCDVDVVAYDQTPCIDSGAARNDDGTKATEAPNGFHTLAYGGNALPFRPVLRGDASAAAAHPARALLLCWPPKEEYAGAGGLTPEQACMAVDALQQFQGATVFYIGCDEGTSGGAGDGAGGGAGDGGRTDTAGPRFHAALAAEWDLVQSVELPSWPQVDDNLTVWRRRGAPISATAKKSAIASFRPFVEDLESEVDRVTRELTLAMLRSDFDRQWMSALFARRLRERLSASSAAVADADRRMLDRCVERLSPAWVRAVVGFARRAV